ncbi:hypothetical protein ASG73_04450 [Janibacter sp. Soil728]|uniref:hypothetical protein n=1 Tax=Janibacter sp. Soil728 TaxID=1736393 RepID=UPI0006F73BB4|nr:hypothetical protein [Janibacter sp. Soil728]KRE38219.1 hypothetical protein ASG73_04450 [Janibacter sp. Soil728]
MSAPTGQTVADFLGAGDDVELVALASQHVLIVTAMARTYVRGNGFTEGDVSEDIAAVITTATARMVANPEQINTQIGSTAVWGGFQGWSLAELFVLNSWRGRAA